MQPKDRLQKLLDTATNTKLNGIDFVEIAGKDQKTLRVHFLNTNVVKGTVTSVTITGGETIPTVRVLPPVDGAGVWSSDPEGRPMLTLKVPAPGDFSFYTMQITSSALDAFFNQVKFSFKANCPSDLDCAPVTPPCPPLSGDLPPIDYLAKDFYSFRKALSDFSTLRYPQWQERSEADFGVMFLESLCSVADDLSYGQDRVAAEATLLTATQRTSIVRQARLVDYEPQPPIVSHVLLQLEVQKGPLPSGLLVSASNPDGTLINFETGTGLIDPATGAISKTSFVVNALWNRLKPDGTPNLAPYYWDDSQRCLRAGSTEMWIVGHGFNFVAGQKLLIDTAAATSADPPIREVVQLVSADEEIDPLFPTPSFPTGVPVTHIVWRPDDALIFDHDLTRTVLAGNLVPATQGRRYTESFAIDHAPASSSQVPPAIVRTGPNGSLQYLYTLRNAPLAWLEQDVSGAAPLPEILLRQISSSVSWTWRRRLLDAEEFEPAFTVDRARYKAITRNSDGSYSYDYDGDAGDTIRFGDDVFGEVPESGSVFQVTYRVGGGAVGNVSADSITIVDPSAAGVITAVTNPFAAQGGADEETDLSVRRLAPQALRATRLFDVRPEDYQTTAQTLPWVLRAGTVFRWTGSWLTVFTTADPRGTEKITVAEQTDLINLLNRYRLAGYESYCPAPRFVSIDLIVTVCAQPTAFRGDVEAAVLAALSATKAPDGTTGFFFLDRFTFGTPLERSALEAAIQAAYGVAGVVSIFYRERGVTPDFVDLPDTLRIHQDQILRVDNDPSRPERGTLQVIVKGGK
jgi:Baseplate J-like protein